MSILRDILDTKNDIEDMSEDNPIKFNQRGSIAKESNPGILQFPVLISSSLSLENATMVCKALEREYVSFITVITSMDSVTDEKSIQTYIKRIHQNVNKSDENMITGAFRESSLFSIPDLSYSTISKLKESEESATALIFQLKDMDGNHFYDEEDNVVENFDDLTNDEKEVVLPIIKEKSCDSKVSKYCESTGINSIIIKESKEVLKHIMIIRNIETNGISLVESVVLPVTTTAKSLQDAKNRVISESVSSLKDYVPDLNMSIINEKTVGNNNFAIIGTGIMKSKYTKKLNEADLPTSLASDLEFRPATIGRDDSRQNIVQTDMLKDNDVKKANELAPTLMHLKTYFKDNNNSLNAVDYVIGVKTVMHNIPSKSMTDNLATCLKRGKAFYNLMRLTTGEISFFKDFVFTITSIKNDIKSKYKDNPWWNSLVKRKDMAGILSKLNFKQQLVPNSSIVISMDEVELLKNEHSLDVMDIKKTSIIMSQLFLLSFVIVDPSIEVCYFLFDGEKTFQKYSFVSLERENSNSQRDIKNIMQVLGRI